MVGLIGPDGVGKSSLLSLLARAQFWDLINHPRRYGTYAAMRVGLYPMDGESRQPNIPS